ncbi:MAG: sigma-54 dependent transcriptional regulator, partial [Caenispirillum sp.]|nr:sigma-54 dependent transcriptional regulator [Caenispirillum sp.]
MPDAAAADTVLFVDDEPDVRLAAQQTLDLAGWRVVLCSSVAEAQGVLGPDFPGIVVSDVRMPGEDGLALLGHAAALDPDLPVVLITGHGDVPMAVEAMRAGAYDFIEKPYRAERLTGTVARAMDKRRLVLENRALRRALGASDVIESRLLGQSPAIREVRRMVAAAAAVDADVLITGETGTGKEVVARCIHEASNRRNGRFVPLNCGAMPEAMIESELFGHEAGSFTGATGRRIGKLEHASGGTLFLDEIESMPLALQVRLLRALQERSIERLGSNTSIPLDLRVVAATKVDLRKAADDGEFREDLYYRLDVLALSLPPLRARGDDIVLLFRHFVLDAAARYGREAPPLPPDLAARLVGHRWPGN